MALDMYPMQVTASNTAPSPPAHWSSLCAATLVFYVVQPAKTWNIYSPGAVQTKCRHVMKCLIPFSETIPAGGHLYKSAELRNRITLKILVLDEKGCALVSVIHFVSYSQNRKLDPRTSFVCAELVHSMQLFLCWTDSFESKTLSFPLPY